MSTVHFRAEHWKSCRMSKGRASQCGEQLLMDSEEKKWSRRRQRVRDIQFWVAVSERDMILILLAESKVCFLLEKRMD